MTLDTQQRSKHILITKDALIQYVTSFTYPDQLLKENHPSIFFSYTLKKYIWSKQYLKGLSMKALVDLCKYLEKYYGVKNE